MQWLLSQCLGLINCVWNASRKLAIVQVACCMHDRIFGMHMNTATHMYIYLYKLPLFFILVYVQNDIATRQYKINLKGAIRKCDNLAYATLKVLEIVFAVPHVHV